MNWLHTLIFDYVWPSCLGNGPESIVEIVVGVVVWQKLLGPRVKKWHQRELEKHHESMKAHVAGEIAKLGGTKPLPRQKKPLASNVDGPTA